MPRFVNTQKYYSSDFLRSTDICPDASTGIQLSHSTRLFTDKKNIWGPSKLCTNRVPLPFDHNIFYMVAMKCIPTWENCDACMCGLMKKIDSFEVYCKFDGSYPDDDRVKIHCNDLDDFRF